MKRIFVLVVGFFLVVGAGGASDEDLVQSRGVLRAFDLFYLFSPANPDHLERVLQLRELANDTTRSFRLVTVSHDGYEAAELAQIERGGEAWMPAAISQRLAGEADYVVLVEREDRRVRAEGSGSSMENVLALLERRLPVSTEVDESTWGKIKDLFQ